VAAGGGAAVVQGLGVVTGGAVVQGLGVVAGGAVVQGLGGSVVSVVVVVVVVVVVNVVIVVVVVVVVVVVIVVVVYGHPNISHAFTPVFQPGQAIETFRVSAGTPPTGE